MTPAEVAFTETRTWRSRNLDTFMTIAHVNPFIRSSNPL